MAVDYEDYAEMSATDRYRKRDSLNEAYNDAPKIVAWWIMVGAFVLFAVCVVSSLIYQGFHDPKTRTATIVILSVIGGLSGTYFGVLWGFRRWVKLRLAALEMLR